MKKIAILFPLAALSLIACVKNENQETKNNRLIWAEKIQSNVPLSRPGAYLRDKRLPVSEEDWHSRYRFDRQKIVTSITNAVLSGKLKAYRNSTLASQDNAAPLTPEEFKNLFVRYDSIDIEDASKPNGKYKDVLKTEITKDYFSSLEFFETMELDTVSYTFVKRVSAVSFLVREGDIIHDFKENGIEEGEVEVFFVKFND